MKVSFDVIGKIHTPFHDKDDTPIQSARSTASGFIDVLPKYAEGLVGIDGFSHLILVYMFDRVAKQFELKVKPFLDDKKHGIFATRYPDRPNPIGLSIVQLVSHKGNTLEILGVDMLDGTPLLDIKPYVPDFDIHSVSKVGWYANRSIP